MPRERRWSVDRQTRKMPFEQQADPHLFVRLDLALRLALVLAVARALAMALAMAMTTQPPSNRWHMWTATTTRLSVEQRRTQRKSAASQGGRPRSWRTGIGNFQGRSSNQAGSGKRVWPKDFSGIQSCRRNCRNAITRAKGHTKCTTII